MSKKLIALLLAASLCCTFFASCTSSQDDHNNGEDTNDSVEGENNEAAVDVSVAEIHTAVKEAYGEEYIPNMPLDAEMFESKFGIKPEWVTEFVAEEPMISFNVDTFIVVKPSEGNLENVKTALFNYADILKNDSLQYPSNVAKVKAVQCYEKNGLVFLYMLGFISDELLYGEGEYAELDPAALETAQYEAFLAQNQRATDAINAVFSK